MGDTKFYLVDFTDEVLPSLLEEPTLAGWASWLAKGGERSNPDYGGEDINSWCFDPPPDGAEYAASSLTFEEDVIATRSDDGERIGFSRPIPPDIDFMAVRFAAGMGWDPESILDPTCSFGGTIEQQLVEEIMLSPGAECIIAIARSESHQLRYRAGPPRLEIVETVAP